MKKTRKAKTALIKPDVEVVESVEVELYKRVRSYIAKARAKVYAVANKEMVAAYWNVGREIVEKQGGAERAKYGDGLIKGLSLKLTAEFGSGFDVANLRNMRQFFLVFGKRYTLCSELNWSHYRTLMRIEDGKKRQFYFEECAKSGWSVRDLQRQISTQFYERLLANHVDLKKASGYLKRSRPEYWNGSIPWASAKDFKAFRFDDSEDHVTELALAKINAVHEWICTDDKKKLKSYRQQHAEDSEKGCCQAVFYVRRTIQNGWSRDALRRRRSAICRDSVQVEERQGGRMADYTLILCGDSTGFRLAKLARPLSVLIRQSLLFICSEKLHDHLAVGC